VACRCDGEPARDGAPGDAEFDGQSNLTRRYSEAEFFGAPVAQNDELERKVPSH